MKTVLDTGIFVSALITDKGFPYKALELWINKQFELVTSEWQVEELKTVSRYKHISRLTTPHQVGSLVNRIYKHATMPNNIPDIDVSSDPKDNPILAVVIYRNAFFK